MSGFLLRALGGCSGDADQPESALATATAALSSACVLGDGYIIASGHSRTVAHVTCPSDCYDSPNGGFADPLFCLNGVLGESDPILAGGSVAPFVVAAQYNGYGKCTALPNGRWGQSADRRTCIWH